MRETVRKLLRALSNPEEDLDVKKTRQLMDLKKLDPMKIFYRTLDEKIYNGDREIPVRVYFPGQEEEEGAVLLFFHGGGFVTESVESYNRICWNMARATGCRVVSVDYRLAPEHRFPAGLEDCYAVAKAVFQKRKLLRTNPEQITLIGDSAGGNLAAAVSLMARDRGEFAPRRQILIYPCLNNDYSDQTPYDSVRENGQDYLLTQRDMMDYLELYQSSVEDRKNPYFAPLLADNLESLPRTLILTGEFDPLRDEGEAYAEKIREAKGEAEAFRISDGVHGYLMMPLKYPAVKETYERINCFLGRRGKDVSDREK